jgi:hypothetical protein
MKIKLLRYFGLVFLLTITIECKKEQAPDPDSAYMVYSNSRGIIGTKGGKVMFDKDDSPLNGSSIIIPGGALPEKTEIILEMDNTVRSTLDTLANILKLEPDGLRFNKPVQLKMVRKGLVNPIVYCFWPDSDSVEEMHITEIDYTDGFVTVSPNHLSYYFVSERESAGFEATLSQTASTMKAGLHFGAGATENLSLSKIPVRNLPDLKEANVTNALELIAATEPAVQSNTLHANIEVTLEEVNPSDIKPIKKLSFDVFRSGDNLNNFGIKVVQNNVAGRKVFNTGIVDLQTLEDFFSGKALVFNFGLNSLPGEKYQLSLSWILYGGASGDQKLTGSYKLSSFNYHVPWVLGYNMSIADNDTNNNFINDYYDKFSAN